MTNAETSIVSYYISSTQDVVTVETIFGFDPVPTSLLPGMDMLENLKPYATIRHNVFYLCWNVYIIDLFASFFELCSLHLGAFYALVTSADDSSSLGITNFPDCYV